MFTDEKSERSEKAFTLNFLRKPSPAFEDQDQWLWQPVKSLSIDSINTATFSGKNQSDDYERE